MNQRSKPLRPPKKTAAVAITTAVPRADSPTPPPWNNFQGTSQFVGTSPSGRVTVFVDAAIDPAGMQNAQDLLNDADRVATANDSIFGTTGGPVSVIVFALHGQTDGTGGADHMGCDYVNGAAIEVDASYGNSMRVSALFEAELSECSMNGNLCGESTGEALSRWCAAVVGHNALADFATAPTWQQDGMADWVNQTEGSDTEPDSTGCGMAFISWLISKGYGLEKIAPAMVSLGDAGTLAQLYGNLTGDDPGNAWNNFQAAIQGLAGPISNDDPFNGLAQPLQMARVSPMTLELAGKVFASILADIAGGKQPEHVTANVRALMQRTAVAGVCKPKSKRLLPPDKPGPRKSRTA